MPGYSDTQLIKKLGIKPSMHVFTINAPEDYGLWLGALPFNTTRSQLNISNNTEIEFIHIFSKKGSLIEKYLNNIVPKLISNGIIWISWPKKTSRVSTDLSGNVIRKIALPLGLIDIKVCAVSEIWSGLKFVIRRSERGKKYTK
jgi:hypothetical protein